MVCNKCYKDLVRDPKKDYFSEGRKYEAWSCPNCDYTFHSVIHEAEKLKDDLLQEDFDG